METLGSYFNRYYHTESQLAHACAITTIELNELIVHQLVPKASYIVDTNGVCTSQAFGKFPAEDALTGSYFHPGNATWVQRAKSLKNNVGITAAKLSIKSQFIEEFALALTELDRTIFRLTDSFTDQGIPNIAGLNARTEAAWHHFLNGIFSLCVADPSSAKSIANKEIHQEALIALTGNGRCAELSPSSRKRIYDLMNAYADYAMPFAPPEYPRSSRKRLVEDLKLTLDTL